MNIEFDSSKEYTIEELKELQNNLYNIKNLINDKIAELQIKDYDFTNKFIYSQEYGYMFVTWQRYDKKSIYNDERMFFQGLGVNANLGYYRDDSWFAYSALKEWNIPINIFLQDVKEGNIKEITKEEFLQVIKENTSKLEKEIPEWIEYIEEQNEESKAY